ncbi:hypothetical protein BDZ94DRAFT_1309562 [Collybia nuda]|uniref:Uncharacterized protein n=1 Tax=Collybia nuda TaxID=64659 RepID=A0A9P5Y5J5_9AGAR|nr:hypothetical protein BDZ94DRAFT_1309562 [Collybia nuda]
MAIVVAPKPLHTFPIHSSLHDNFSDDTVEDMTEIEAELDYPLSDDAFFGPSSPENQLGLPENRNWFGHFHKAESSSCESSVPKDNSDTKIKPDIVPEECNMNISTINPLEGKFIIEVCIKGGNLINPVFNFNFQEKERSKKQRHKSNKRDDGQGKRQKL